MKPRLRLLRWLRQSKNLTQADLAKLTGISQHSISKLETGQTAPRPETALRLADALGVSPRTLGGGGFGRSVSFTEILEAPAGRRLEYVETLAELGDLEHYRGQLAEWHQENLARHPKGAPEYIGSKLEAAMMLGYLKAFEEVTENRGVNGT
jgi:transcriptional regulator with XRE-family HTH domain